MFQLLNLNKILHDGKGFVLYSENKKNIYTKILLFSYTYTYYTDFHLTIFNRNFAFFSITHYPRQVEEIGKIILSKFD